MTREEAENRFFEWANQSNLELQSESDFLRTQIAIARTAFMAGWVEDFESLAERWNRRNMEKS